MSTFSKAYKLGMFRSSKSSSICLTGRPEASIDGLFYWSIFPIIYYAYLHTLKLFKRSWNLRLLQWRMKKIWPATFVDIWTVRFCSFAQAWVCQNAWEFKRIPVEKPLLWHVWYKDTVQVSDGFGNKRGVLIYYIKLQRKSNFSAGLLGLRGREGRTAR